MTVELSLAVGTYQKMLSFTNKEKADMHFINGTANINGSKALPFYEEQFPNRRLPNHKTFEQLYQQLCELYL